MHDHVYVKLSTYLIVFSTLFKKIIIYMPIQKQIIRLRNLIKKGDTGQQWTLTMLMLSLHAIVYLGFQSSITTALLLAHYGLFLIWQPIWGNAKTLSVSAAIAFVAGGLLFVFAAGWWMIAVWISALFGLLGGRLFSAKAKGAHSSYLISAGYFLAVLLVWVAPKLIGEVHDTLPADFAMRYILPTLPLGVLLIQMDKETQTQPAVLDFFYSLLLFSLVVILLLGAFAIAAIQHLEYLMVISYMVFGISATLVLLSLIWNPRAGFAGLGQLLSRYLMSVGMPFERWLKNIAELANLDTTPIEFAEAAMAEVAALPWVSGGAWQTPEGQGEFGERSQNHAAFDVQEFSLTLFTRTQLTSSLTIHIKLLTQLLGEFYEAKKRAAEMREQAYMQAVYETGARLTHDMKNLLQSLNVLATAAMQAEEQDTDRLLALVKRQLPQLNSRLKLTLDNLQAPNKERTHMINAITWWEAIKYRYSTMRVDFVLDKIPDGVEVNLNLFDSIAENLLQNALRKASEEGKRHKIEVTLAYETNGALIQVRDNGHSIPEEVASKLLKAHVPSETGLGIGLFHAAKQADQSGYQLRILNNQEGDVCFELSPKAST